MVGMTDIAQFLAARLDEDEERAELAQSVIAGSWDGWGVIAPQLHACCDTVPNIDRAGQHLYVNADPARVLAEVAAKREHLRMWVQQREMLQAIYANPERYSHDQQVAAATAAGVLEAVVRQDLAIYDAYPDYDPAWRVE